MLYGYGKGARSERELLNIFYEKGYSVIRSAGSGVNSIAPDIVVIKNGTCISFECKAWKKSRISIDLEGYDKLSTWEKNTCFPTYVAWRMNAKGWFFIKLDELKKGERDYSITMKRAKEINRLIDKIY
jgi:Holliday junction resolvase